MSAVEKVVLLVDDEPDLREILRFILETEGWRVIEARGGAEALKLFAVSPEITLVITDIRMPQGNGIELVTKIRELSPSTPPIVLITGYSDVPDDEARALGAQAVLHKPFAPDDLEEIIKDLVN